LCLLLGLLTLTFYNRVIDNGFVNLDDNGYITKNDHVQEGLTWKSVKWAFTTKEAANWHPLTWLSHELDYQLFKQNPVGHHYVNVLMHSGNAVLLFLLLESVTGMAWPSFMVAALFAIHPMNVESVAWVSERKNVLSMLFFLLTLHAYGWYVRLGSVRRYLVVAGLFALGLMAKPEIITLPFVLLLWDYWPLRRMWSGSPNQDELAEDKSIKDRPRPTVRSLKYLILEKIPLMALSAGSGVITMIAQRAGMAVRTASLKVRLSNAAVSYMRYLGKAVWPEHLAALYPHPGRFLPAWEAWASAVALLSITALVLRWPKRRYLAMGWFWFLGMMVPVIGLVQVGVQGMADRYAYWPYIGLFIAVTWGLAEIVQERKITATWFAIPSLAVLLFFGMLTRRQISYWHDSVTLWRHTLSITKRNYFAHNSLAYALAEQGRTEDAMVEFDAAESLHAYSASDIVWYGAWEQAHGHLREAMVEYTRSLEASTDSKSRSEALARMGSGFTQMGDIDRAKMSYEFALKENPDNSIALVGSGLLAEREGDLQGALERIQRAMTVEPTDVGYLMLEQALRKAGRLSEADNARAQAQRLSNNFTQSEISASKVLASAGIKSE
jgi:Tfp pilus assembly protein PilF